MSMGHFFIQETQVSQHGLHPISRMVIRHSQSHAVVTSKPIQRNDVIEFTAQEILLLLDVAFELGERKEYNRVNQNEQDYRPGANGAASI